MKLAVTEVELGNQLIATPPQEIYQNYPCPICRQTSHLQMLAIVQARGRTSLESAYCTRCQHRFHRKFPHLSWLAQYYDSTFESSAQRSPSRAAALYRHLRSRLGRYVKYGFAQNIPNRVHDFCLGVTKEFSFYHRANERIRKVLEIGCGLGVNLRFFRDRGYDTYGTEANAFRQAMCRAHGLKVFPAELDSFRSVAPFAPFDFIYSVHVLEHVIDIDQHVGQLVELLAPGGFIYLETPDLSGESFFHQSHTIYHVQTFSAWSMQALVRRHGLEPVRLLVDNNVQLLAHKAAGSPRVVPEAPPAEFSPERVPYLESLQAATPGRFRVEWDYYNVAVHSLDQQRSLYQAPLGALTVAPAPSRSALTCLASGAGTDQPLFPVVFDYPDLTEPPIWYRN